MKILFLCPSIKRGGAEEYVLKMALASKKKNWDVHVTFPNRKETQSLINDLNKEKITYHSIELEEKYEKGFFKAILIFLKLIRTLWLLAKLKPNVVQINLPDMRYSFGSILACALFNIPTVVTFHLVNKNINFTKLELYLYHWAFHRKQKWLSVSMNNGQIIEKSFKLSRGAVVVIHNGIKVDSFKSLLEDRIKIRKQVREELGIGNVDIVMLTVGRLSYQKGYDNLIKLIPKINKDYSNVKWIWVGEGELRESLEHYIKKLKLNDDVMLLGYRKDVLNILYAADYFVFPTRYEGFPFALMEAMAAEVPIVTTDASSITELIEHMRHGVVAGRKTGLSLENAIKYALDNQEDMVLMARNSEEHIFNFTEEKMINSTLRLFMSMTH